MSRMSRRSAFTLVEILIVVVILAILAAAVIPQFTDSSNDAKNSTSLFNLQTFRGQIAVYKAQHGGLVPTGADATAITNQLCGKTLADGRRPEPGGWNRFQLEVADLPGEVERLRAAGARFRSDILTGVGGDQVLVEDPAGNPVELFQPHG